MSEDVMDPNADTGELVVACELPLTSFSESWQATAYGIVEGLKVAGVLGLQEWANALGAELAAIGQETEAEYYEAWLRALEKIAQAKGLVGDAEMTERVEAWRYAYSITPHGKPIVLQR